MHRLIRKVLAPACASAILGLLALNAVATATTATWVDRDSSPGDLWDVVYGGGKFVAISDGGSIISKTSTDGLNWTSHSLPQPLAERDWWRVAYGGTAGNEQFVLVPYGGNTILRSGDGMSWAESPAIQGNWVAITYGGGKFIAAAEDKMMYSTNEGSTWTELTTTDDPDLDGNWNAIAYGGPTGNEVFVALSWIGGGLTRVVSSPDGLNWTSQRTDPLSGPGLTDPPWSSLTFGGGRFVAVANVGNCNATVAACADAVMWSANGTVWNPVTLPTVAQGRDWGDIAYGQINGVGTFVAVANFRQSSRAPGTQPLAMTSTDGVSWTADTSVPSDGWLNIAYGNGVFVAAGPGSSKIMSLGQPLPPPAPSVTSTDPAPADPAPSQDNPTNPGSNPAAEQPSGTGETPQPSVASQAVTIETSTTLPPFSTTAPVAAESSAAPVAVSRAASKAGDLPSTGAQTSSLPAIVAVMLAGFMILGLRRRGHEACSGDARTPPRARRENT